MQRINGSITTLKEKYKVEDMLLTYDEEEKQQHEINAVNASLIFSPKFIPFYPDLQARFNLTNTETLIFGFIDFFKANASSKFYFTNEQIGKIVNCSADTVSRGVSRLEELHLLKTSRRIRAGGGTTRFVTDIFYKSDLTFSTSHTRQKLQTNNNKKNENKIYKTVTNGFLNNFPRRNTDKDYIEYLVNEILTQLKDTHSEPFYRLVAAKIPEGVIRQFLQEIKADGANDPAKLFVHKIKQYCEKK